jgi:hypothetical protein
MEDTVRFTKYSILIVTLLGMILFLGTQAVPSALASSAGPLYPGTGSNASGIGTMAWNDPGNITADDDVIATATLSSGEITQYLQGTNFNFQIPDGSSIESIAVTIGRSSSGDETTSIQDYRVQLVKNDEPVGTNYADLVTLWPMNNTEEPAVYEPLDPLWGTTWTAAEINAGGFGVALSAINQDGSATANVDYFQITVNYTLPGTTTAVSCGTATVAYGAPLTCQASVTRLAGSNTPSGTVSWSTDGSGSLVTSPCSLTGADGTAACSVSYTPTAVGSGTHTLTATYAGDANFSGSSGDQAVTVTKAEALIEITPYDVTYDGEAHTASGTATGVESPSPADLSGLLNLSGTTHTDAGDYTADAWTFAGDANYNSASGSVNDKIAKAEALIAITAYDLTYDGEAHTASGTATGVESPSPADLSGLLNLSGTTHTDAGDYTADAWSFAGDTNYTGASGSVNDRIAKAEALIAITAYDLTYDGTAHTASGSATGAQGEALDGLDLAGTTHTYPGSYTDPWSFSDVSGNYNNDNGTIVNHIAKANAACTITPYDVVFTGAPHTAQGACLGVDQAALSGLDLSGTTHTHAGVYDSDPWVFNDVTGNYTNASGSVADNIAKAQASCVVSGYTVEYDKQAHLATGSCTGVMAEALGGLDLSGTAHSAIGVYPSDAWIYNDLTGNYRDGTGTVNDQITLRSITVTADAITKPIGSSDPWLTYRVTAGSLLAGDSFIGSLAREPGEEPGSYQILQGSLSLWDYYDLHFVGAVFTILERQIFIPIIVR